mmetsp:Transcript_10173/g.27898  ORF Transcript_10173/g.27898 Transcript_10173/m.27898 type:complete len:307 (+) Transcript_10173:2319-3239(+)
MGNLDLSTSLVAQNQCQQYVPHYRRWVVMPVDALRRPVTVAIFILVGIHDTVQDWVHESEDGLGGMDFFRPGDERHSLGRWSLRESLVSLDVQIAPRMPFANAEFFSDLLHSTEPIGVFFECWQSTNEVAGGVVVQYISQRACTQLVQSNGHLCDLRRATFIPTAAAATTTATNDGVGRPMLRNEFLKVWGTLGQQSSVGLDDVEWSLFCIALAITIAIRAVLLLIEDHQFDVQEMMTVRVKWRGVTVFHSSGRDGSHSFDLLGDRIHWLEFIERTVSHEGEETVHTWGIPQLAFGLGQQLLCDSD